MGTDIATLLALLHSVTPPHCPHTGGPDDRECLCPGDGCDDCADAVAGVL